MEGTLTIAAKTKRVDVDNRLPLKYYYRTADNLLKQVFKLDCWPGREYDRLE